MKKLLIFTLTCLFAGVSLYAQQTGEFATDNIENKEEATGEIAKYRRSSLYSVLIKHSSFPYSAEIESAFLAMPTPDKFNDHNISPRVFESSATTMRKAGNAKDRINQKDIQAFLTKNQIGKELVSKWFNRNRNTGAFDMSLIQERGYYDASQLDIATVSGTVRGISALGDAGVELVGKTFVIVNDITFVDKGENSSKAAGILFLIGDIAAGLTGESSFRNVGATVAAATNEIDGFNVNITTYLYRLKWNDEISSTFYNDYWTDGSDPSKISAFNQSKLFSVEYIGQTSTSAANLSSKNFSEQSKGDQMLRVCARAVDKSIVQLQREYDEFKVNVPIYKVAEDRKTVEVQIGLKEGINEKSQFEVLMPVELEDGRMRYDRVGMIQPVAGKIWDNRFGALEEALDADASGKGSSKNEEVANLESASLTASTFKILSGAGRIIPGCLVREVTIKRK